MKTRKILTRTESSALEQVRVRLITDAEHDRWNALVDDKHYLSSHLVGPALRYVAELDGDWLGLLSFGQGSYHLREREAHIGWNDVQRGRRLCLVGQNTRFVLLYERGHYPNLASRMLSLGCNRVSSDWEARFGNPLVAVETFVDPERFSGGCYRAAGWERLGETAGFGRRRKDFYQRHDRPKDLWFKVLDRRGFRSLSSRRLPPRLKAYETEWRVCPFKAPAMESLFECFDEVPDHRARRGRRYRLQTLLSVIALATLCGFSGHRAIASFASKLTEPQRRRLRCPRNRRSGQYDVPKETCIREVLYELDAEALENVLVRWMEGLDESELRYIAIDGKTLKGTAKRNEAGEKKGALHLVSAVNHENGRLIAQQAVESKSNEIPAVEELIGRIPYLDGIVISTDALNCQQKTARVIVQEKGGTTTFDCEITSQAFEKRPSKCSAPT